MMAMPVEEFMSMTLAGTTLSIRKFVLKKVLLISGRSGLDRMIEAGNIAC